MCSSVESRRPRHAVCSSRGSVGAGAQITVADRKIEIDPDIRRAKGPPGELYADPYWFDLQRRKLFPRTWHLVSHAQGMEEPGRVRPFTLLEGCLEVPLLLVRDSRGELFGLSNVCTHRGNRIVEGEWTLSTLRCRYHGRRFHLDGTFAFMPDFAECEGFPTDADYLPKVAVAAWRGLIFGGLRPVASADDVVSPVEQRLATLALTDWHLEPSATREWDVDANWALVCENLIDGFHIAGIHPQARARIVPEEVRFETWPYGSLRIDVADRGTPCFELPAVHPDHSRRIASYLFWIFPATVVQVYPWGMRVVALEPRGASLTHLRRLVFVGDRGAFPADATAAIRREEDEDEAIVRLLQAGAASPLHRRGRYSPSREVGVHHFHRLLAAWMAGGAGA